MTHLTVIQRQALTAFIEQLEEKFAAEASNSASAAFNIGCMLSVIVVLAVGILVWVWGHWVTAWVAMLITGMLALVVVAYLAMRSRGSRADVIYLEEILPQIKTKIDEVGIRHADFEVLARTTLPEGALLRQFVMVIDARK